MADKKFMSSYITIYDMNKQGVQHVGVELKQTEKNKVKPVQFKFQLNFQNWIASKEIGFSTLERNNTNKAERTLRR